MKEQTTETTVKPIIIKDGKSEKLFFRRKLNRHIKKYNNALDELEKKYPFLKLTNDEVRDLVKEKFPKSLSDKIYPVLPPDIRKEYVWEVRSAFEAESSTLRFNMSYEFNTPTINYVEVENSRLIPIRNLDDRLNKMFVRAIHSEERINQYKKAKKMIVELEKLTKQLGFKSLENWMSIYRGKPVLNPMSFVEHKK